MIPQGSLRKTGILFSQKTNFRNITRAQYVWRHQRAVTKYFPLMIKKRESILSKYTQTKEKKKTTGLDGPVDIVGIVPWQLTAQLL